MTISLRNRWKLEIPVSYHPVDNLDGFLSTQSEVHLYIRIIFEYEITRDQSTKISMLTLFTRPRQLVIPMYSSEKINAYVNRYRPTLNLNLNLHVNLITMSETDRL